MSTGPDGDPHGRGKHGVSKPFSEWRQFEYAVASERGYMNSDAWSYVGRVIDALVRDETTGQEDVGHGFERGWPAGGSTR
jgi:hypothetical protein